MYLTSNLSFGMPIALLIKAISLHIIPDNLENIEKFANILGYYSGERTTLHKQFIPNEFYENAKEKALKYYFEFVDKDANNEIFKMPDYTTLFS